MREEKVAKDKEKKETARVLTQIEEKASRSYQKDVSTFQKARDSNATSLGAQTSGEGIGDGSTTSGGWEHDTSSGYYYNKSNGCYYDPNSGFYYTDALGKWVTQEEAFAAAAKHSSGPVQKKPIFATPSLSSKGLIDSKPQRSSVNPTRSVNKPSSIAINKRKRADTKPKIVSEEEAAALKAREAARKRVEEREKSSLGLYKH